MSPFTLRQAIKISLDFAALKNVSLGDSLVVAEVAVAPYPAAALAIFTERYADCEDPEEAIAFYPGPDYDVCLLCYKTHDDSHLGCISIRQYVTIYDVDYDFPETR